jgi:hypothetical protein
MFEIPTWWAGILLAHHTIKILCQLIHKYGFLQGMLPVMTPKQDAVHSPDGI